MNLRSISVLSLLLLIFSTADFALAKKTAKLGDEVKVEYLGSLKDGRVFDHNVGKEPIVFTIGANKMIKAFEDAFIGMEKGETKTVDIAAKDAYGEFRKAKLFRISKEQLPEGAKVGDTLNYRVGGGFYPVRIIHIGENEVFIDANHKLAGKDLSFKVTLLDFKKAEKKG